MAVCGIAQPGKVPTAGKKEAKAKTHWAPSLLRPKQPFLLCMETGIGSKNGVLREELGEGEDRCFCIFASIFLGAQLRKRRKQLPSCFE